MGMPPNDFRGRLFTTAATGPCNNIKATANITTSICRWCWLKARGICLALPFKILVCGVNKKKALINDCIYQRPLFYNIQLMVMCFAGPTREADVVNNILHIFGWCISST